MLIAGPSLEYSWIAEPTIVRLDEMETWVASFLLKHAVDGEYRLYSRIRSSSSSTSTDDIPSRYLQPTDE